MERQLSVLEAQEQGYLLARILPSGVCAGVAPQLYTFGLFVDIRADYWGRRYCYETCLGAVWALLEWDGEGDPPGPWIKEKPSDRLGPGALCPSHPE